MFLASLGLAASLRARLPRFGFAAILLAIAGLGFGGCAQRPQEVAAASHGKEYFPSSVYGPASRRVIADGQPVPRGGGQYLVGKPYTIAGRTYYPSESRKTQVGSASWYGDAFHGRLTANGEIYDRDSFTAASPTMPLPSYARVTNLRNNYSMIVRVNDRGPYASNRIMDVSRRVAEALDYKRYGTTTLKVEYVGRASLAGSDDARLYATLRNDGPARWRGEQPSLVADAAPPAPARVASIAPYAPSEDAEAEPAVAAPRRRVAAPREVDDERPAPARRVIAVEDREPARRRAARDDRAPAFMPPARPRYAADHAFEHPSAHRGAQRFAVAEIAPPPRPHFDAVQIGRVLHSGRHEAVVPPSRPMDLGTIPGAGSQIHAHREAARREPARRDTPRLHMARARDD